MAALLENAEGDGDNLLRNLVKEQAALRGTGEYETKVRICLCQFPFNEWGEGPHKIRTLPVIVMPTNVLDRYHPFERETTTSKE
jgi:hypothetical protein